MGNLRIVVTFLIVLIIALLSVFQMQLRGYEKIERLNQWVLYYQPQEACPSLEEVFYQDETYVYSFSCLKSERYMVKNGFEEHPLKEALELGYISIDDLSGVIDFQTTLISHDIE